MELRRQSVALGATLLALTAGLVACGDDEPAAPTATEQVCSARADLADAVQVVVDDVKAANLGDARTHAADVGTAFDELTAAVQELAADEREELQPSIDAVTAQITALGDADSIAGLQTAVASIGTDLDALLQTVRDDLDCDGDD